MKAVFFAMFLLLISTPAFAQEKESPALQLTTKITLQRYCKSKYSDTVEFKLSLQLIYTNVGQQPVILDRGSNEPIYILVSLNEQDARNKKYEVNMHQDWWTSGGSRIDEGYRPGDEFTVLKPGRSFKTWTNIGIPISLEPDGQYLKPGHHVLQVVIDGWAESEKQFEKLKKKWKDTGLLWGGPTRSEPMPIEVEQQPNIKRCRELSIDHWARLRYATSLIF